VVWKRRQRWRTRAELGDRAVRLRHLTRAYQLVMLTRAFDRREAEASEIADANAARQRQYFARTLVFGSKPETQFKSPAVLAS
jgi:hypothetical protein